MVRQRSEIQCLLLVAVLLWLAPPPAGTGTEYGTRRPIGDEQSASWSRSLADRSQRGTLHDAAHMVRGDSGKWSEEFVWKAAPATSRSPTSMPLDDWFDQTTVPPAALGGNVDSWLLLRTPQLDDNDRVWVERVERQGQQISVVLRRAVWQGTYQKNFTYYHVFGINVGQLEPGTYQARCVILSSAFSQFEGTGQPRDNWPKDEQATGEPSQELSLRLTIAEAPP